MSVAYDNVASASRAVGGAASPINYNLTVNSVAGGGYIVVGVAVGFATPTAAGVSCTIGGVTATSLGTVASNNGTTGGVALFGLVSNTTGTVAISVSFTGDDDYTTGAMSFTGVDQSTPAGTVGTNFGSTAGTITVNITDSTASDVIASACCQGSGNATLGAVNTTHRWQIALNGSSAGGCGAGGTTPGASGTTSVDYSFTGNDVWGIVAIAIKAAGGGGGRAWILRR